MSDALEGEVPEFSDLLVRYLPAVRAFVRANAGRILRYESASDIAQSAARSLLHRLPQNARALLQAQAVKGWLFREARRKILDRVRYREAACRSGPTVRVEDARVISSTPAAEALALAKENAQRLREAICTLPDRYRAVLELLLAGHSREAVATSLHITTKAYQHLEARAMARLAGMLTHTH